MKQSLQRRTVAISAAALLIMMATLGLTITALYQSRIAALFESEAEVVADDLVAKIHRLLALGLYIQDLAGFEEQCRQAVARRENIDHAFVLDTAGQVLYADSPLPADAISPRTIAALVLGEPGSVRIGDLHMVIAPVIAGPEFRVGTVVTMVAENAISGEVSEMAAIITASGLIILALGAALHTVFMKRFVTQRIVDLAARIENTHADNLRDVKALSAPDDEIGHIWRAFVKLLDALATTQDELLVSQEKLRRHSTDLEQQVHQRTHELEKANADLIADIETRKRLESRLRLHEEQLRAAMLETERANRSKSEFLANMSHELRTPLNSIIGFSQFIQQDGEMLGIPRCREYAGDILECGEHLLRLINQILDLSKVEVGKLELIDGVVDIAAVIADTLTIQEIAATRNGTRLINRVEAGALPKLRADDLRLKQVFINLISNAIKFTPGGSVTITGQRLPRGLSVQIRDTGRGMRQEDITVALQPFGQVDRDVFRTDGSGTGLGLPIAQKLVEMHGGELFIASAPGAGTTVEIRFPESRIL